MGRTAGVISAMILACMSIYCFLQYFNANGSTPSFGLATFAVSALYGALVGLYEVTDSKTKLREHVDFIADTVVAPFLAAEMWLMVGIIPKEAAWFHGLAGAIPVVLHFMDKKVKDDFMDALQVCSVVSLIAAGVLGSNFYAIGAGASYGAGRFSFRKGKNCMDFDCVDMFNYALCGFTACGLLALTGALY